MSDWIRVEDRRQTRTPWSRPETLEEFARRYGLTMVVTRHTSARTTAHFEWAEIKDGPILRSDYGEGSTPRAAMKDYMQLIVGKTLVIRAHTPDRAEIQVPADMTHVY